MATWWEERATRVNRAIDMIAAQTPCTHAEAIALLRQRAEAMETDLEEAAAAVVDLGTRLGYRDLTPSPPSEEPADEDMGLRDCHEAAARK